MAYQKFGNFTQMDTMFTNVKTDFEAKFAGSTLELIPIQAAENDYYTKLALMNRSASTAPDLMYEDTFMVRSDVAAGYLAPLDSYLNGWSDWSQFVPAAKDAGKADDGKIYGVSLGTDTRGLWYNKDLLAQVGITGDWKPKDWNELLSVAKNVKAKLPGVIPLNIYSGKPTGEASTMQGFEMLLYGCPNGTLYNTDQGKWVVGSKPFKDSLDFVRTVYTQGLGPTPQQALDGNWGSVLAGQFWPKNKIAMGIDGSWMPSNWLPKGGSPWTEWDKVMGWTGMPTQQGQAPGANSMSGGWTL
ncbi:MAG: extracellular solute-binding protein, partial [Propionibacteriaceae bacterium]